MKGFVFICAMLLLAVQHSRAEPVGTCPPNNEDVDTLLVDSENCAIFYKCDWGVPVVQDCPAGLLFNDVNQQCDFPENVDCTRGGSNVGEEENTNEEQPADGADPVGTCPAENGAKDVLLADSKNCAIYYECVWGEAVAMACPEGLLYNDVSELCDYAENVDCNRDHVVVPDPNPGGEGSDPDPAAECPAVDGKYATYLPDKKDCTKFYICEYGTPVQFSCPEGLLYSGVTWACDYPANVVCGVYVPLEGDSDTPGGSGNPDDEIIDDGNAWVGECTADSDDTVLLAHKYDTHKFFSCVHGTPVELECASDLVFYAELQVCSYA